MEEKKFDCGIDCLLGDVDTELCFEYLYYEVLANNLVGEYTASGNYVIKDDYKNILAGCAKVIEEQNDKNFTVKASIGGFSFNFAITTQKEGGELVSDLTLIEEVKDDNKDFCHTHKTFIAEYRDDDNIYYEAKMLKAFNVFKKDDNKIKDFNQEDYAIKLLEKLKQNKLMQEDMVKFGKEYYNEYIKSLIKILEGIEPGGKFVLKKFSEYLKSISFDKEKGNYYKAMIRLKQLMLSSNIKLNDLQKNMLSKLNQNIIEVQMAGFKKRQAEEKKAKDLIIAAKKQEKKSIAKKKPQTKKTNDNKTQTNKTENQKKQVSPKISKKGEWVNDDLFLKNNHDNEQTNEQVLTM